jgi:glycerol-3-phosphate cytidylyltransferase-like family protein
LGILREVKPDIICVGYDQQQIKASVEKLLRTERLSILVVQIPKFGHNGLNSSTGIKQRVAKSWTKRAKPRRSP